MYRQEFIRAFLSLAFIVILVPACRDKDDDIPGRVPEKKEDVKYNDLGFPAHKDGEMYDTYSGLVMAGYQGWFGCPGDGCSHATHSNTKWYHYRENDMFKPGVLQNSIDFWPDMTEYEKKYDTEFKHPDGSVAQVFSSYDESTVMLHFKWMKEYGLDGVFMQRFVGEVVNNHDGKDHFNKVLKSAMKASNEYQRAICIMYDLGGFMSDSSRGVNQVVADTQELAREYQLFDRNAGQKYYLYENGKPLIVLWGVGFTGTKYTINDCSQLVAKLQDLGFSIMLGVPTYWREGRNDAISDKQLQTLIKSVDVIMPWFVGRFDNNGFANFHSLIKSDISWCSKNGIGYAPLCHVGSSDRNMHPNNTVVSRLGGKFFWNQASFCITAGAKMLYIAMFDEIDEGTAIFKVCTESEVPSNEPQSEYWVMYKNGNYSRRTTAWTGELGDQDWCRKASDLGVVFQGAEDELGSDYYLWITGQVRLMLRGEIPLSTTKPSRK